MSDRYPRLHTLTHYAEQRQYLLCSVAIGRSFVLDDLSAKRELPPGFDSLYLHMPDNGSEGVGEAYRHTYVVFDTAAILPRCVVHFALNPLERLQRRPVARVNIAELKQRIADAMAVLGPAAGAATEKMLTDIGECDGAVSAQCIPSHPTSHPNMAGESYDSALAASQEPDPMLEDRRRAIRATLKSIDDKLRAVQVRS